MTQIIIFLLPIIAAALATPLSWQILHSYYGPQPSELDDETASPLQKEALKALHSFGTWFAAWMLGTFLLAAIVSLLGALAVPLLLSFSFCMLALRPNPKLFWVAFVAGSALLELVLYFLQSLTGTGLTLQDYSVLSQMDNPYYLNPFFILAVLGVTFLTLAAASKRSSHQPDEEKDVIPASLPDPTPPPR